MPHVIVHCHYCKARVQVNVTGANESLTYYDANPDSSHVTDGFRISVGHCVSCHGQLVARQRMSHNELDENGEEYIIWDDAQRIWPNEMATLSTSIPQLIRDSLTEARACLSIDARNGSVVLTGRAVEAIARHFNDNSDAKRILLGPGLKELYDKNVIDERLYRWGREIQEHRNIAAHPAPDDLSELDAEDLLTFAEAMCEYVFVLQERYNAFLTRKRSRRESASGPVNV